MKNRLTVLAAGLALGSATPALASAPSLGEEVEEAIVDPGEVEFETRWDQLAGGMLDGEDVMKAEVAYGLSERIRVSGRVQVERQPGTSRKVQAAGAELIYNLGK